MKHIRLFAAVSLLGIGTAAATDRPASPAKQEIVASCTTRGTELSGVRHACDSAVQVIRAPAGYVLAENSLLHKEYSGNGSEHACTVEWSDFVEIIPGSGITQPASLTIRAHARSPKGHGGGRGWASCRYEVLVSKYVS